jgi:hypothetical protein
LSYELSPLSLAAVLTFDHLFPIAVQAGTTNLITAIGKFEPWPPNVWVDAPGIAFKAETNSGKFSVEVATHARVGPHLVRLHNEEGASGLRFLIVTSEPQVAETEPNDDFAKPQVVNHFPASINGRLDKSGDVDSFAVALERGQTLIASVEAYTLASPVDAVLRLVDARAVQVAWNHDGARTLDPFLAWTAPFSGTYVLQVFGFAYPAESDVKFAGNNKCVYRLHLSRGPYAHHTVPLGVRRGAATSVQLVGWNLGSRRDVKVEGAELPAGPTAALALADVDRSPILAISDGPESQEEEPNDVPMATNRLEVPFAITGCIETSGDEDRFTFAAKKDEKLLIEVQSGSLGFPLDAWLKIEDLNGKELAKNEGSAGGDPKLEWTAPSDSTFAAAVGNLLHRGGPDYLYRLSLQPARPRWRATVSETAFNVTPGKTNELKVTLERLHGFKSKLRVSVHGLPAGVEAEANDVSETDRNTTLKLIASEDVKPFSGPMQIVVAETESNKEQRAVADLTSSSVNNGVPGGFSKLVIDSTDQFWLTVRPAPPSKSAAAQ